MRLSTDIMHRLHREEITPAQAFAIQAARDAGAERLPADLTTAERAALHALHDAIVGSWVRGTIDGAELRRRWHSRLPWEVGPDGVPVALADTEWRRRLALPGTADPAALRGVQDASKCPDDDLPARYAAAAAWIAAHGSPALRSALAAHAAVWEPDPGPKPCVQARRRRQILTAAIAEGFRQATPTPAPAAPAPSDAAPVKMPQASRAIRALCDASVTHAYIVGKGPSLDTLSHADFPDSAAPVVALNEAIHAIEQISLPNPVLCLQQDAGLAGRCRPHGAVWLLSAQAWKAGSGDSYSRAVKYTPSEVGGRTKSLSANMALRYLAKAGFRTATMLGFDACTCRDTGYAASIGETPSFRRNNDGSRFLGHCREIRKVAREAGVQCEWKEPVSKWCVACVLRSGGTYTAQHVDWLRRQVDARVRTPHWFACLTDVAGMPGAVPLQHAWPGWWSKIELFRPGAFAPGTPMLYLDLDVVLCANIILPDPGSLPAAGVMAPTDWWRAGERNSSVMLWRAGAADAVYAAFLVDPAAAMAETPHGDQAWISAHVETADAPLRIKSWKAHRLADGGPGDTHVVVFHGIPKPWQVRAGWVPPLVDQAGAPSGRARWLARTILDRGYATFVEVGVKEGKTTSWVARSCPGVTIYAVDLFVAQPENRGPEDYTRWNWPGIREQYAIAVSPYGSRVRTILADACDAAAMVPGQPECVFLDADHGEAATVAAIEAWRPKIRAGGILCGHDYDWETVRKAVDSVFSAGVQEGDDHVWWIEL